MAYGMVNLPTGKMKSREGTVVDADDLFDEMHELGEKGDSGARRRGNSGRTLRNVPRSSAWARSSSCSSSSIRKPTMMFDPQAVSQIRGRHGTVCPVCLRPHQFNFAQSRRPWIRIRRKARLVTAGFGGGTVARGLHGALSGSPETCGGKNGLLRRRQLSSRPGKGIQPLLPGKTVLMRQGRRHQCASCDL